MSIQGILNIHKPSGITSFDVVRLVKRLSKEKRVGHGGTLDPLADGVLLILVGQGARIADYLLESPKTYRAVIELGITTDSYDIEGSVLTRKDPSHITRKAIEEALLLFKGLVHQEPPMYSALHFDGKRLYDLARRGIVVPRKKRQRMVYRLNLIEWTPPLLTVELECQGGFYVRSFANDLGEQLGCGACLIKLCRLKHGDFALKDALSLEEVKEIIEKGSLSLVIHPVDTALLSKRAFILAGQNRLSFLHGKVVEFPKKAKSKGNGKLALQEFSLPEAELCRIYSVHGDFLAVASWESARGILHPTKVFVNPHSGNY